jgi:DNA-binding NarL/FixJ family response regulator
VHVEAPKPLPGKPLTVREQEVLQLVAAGLQNNEIADELVVRLRTVEFHVTNILEKLSARSRSDARDIARRLGWLPNPARLRTRRPDAPG